nr:uncharacterized protein LOC129154567 [Nothobranchius furzeri]
MFLSASLPVSSPALGSSPPSHSPARADRMNQHVKGSNGEILPWECLLQFLYSEHRPASSPPPASPSPRRRRRHRASAVAFLSTLPETDERLDRETLPDRSSFMGTRLAVCSPGAGPRRGEGSRAPPQSCVPGRSRELAAAPALRSCLDPPPVRPTVPSPVQSAPPSSAGGGTTPTAQLTELADLQAELGWIRQLVILKESQLDNLSPESPGEGFSPASSSLISEPEEQACSPPSRACRSPS